MKPVFIGGRDWPDAVEDSVDDVVDEPGVEWGMTVEKPVVDRAVEEVERDLDFGVGGDLAAFDRAAEDRACLVTAWFHEARAVLAGGRRGGRGGRGDGRERGPRRRR